MLNFDLNTNVILTLNGYGQQYYYLNLVAKELNGEEIEDKLDINTGEIKLSIKEIIDCFGSELLNCVSEPNICIGANYLSLRSEIIVNVSDLGKQIYLLSVKDRIEKYNGNKKALHQVELLEKINDVNQLEISIKDLADIYNGHLDKNIFITDEALIKEEDLELRAVRNR